MIYHRKNKLLLLAWILLILIMLPVVSACSCDRFDHIDGTVYEWVDAPEGATGEIYVDIDPPADRELAPIANASVFFFTKMRTTTDSKGIFDAGPLYLSKRSMMDIRVEKEGYQTLEAEFENTGRGYHELTILLVR